MNHGPVPGRLVGVGVDVVSMERFANTIRRTPGTVDRIIVAGELGPAPADHAVAVVFAAKEAVMKSLGAGLAEVSMQDIRVGSGAADQSARQPGEIPAHRVVELSGRAIERAEALGVARVEVGSITEVRSNGAPFVVAEAFAFG